MNRWQEAALDERAMRESKQRWDNVAKPLNSLGKFEHMIMQIAGIQETPNVRLSPRCTLVFCADHGVVAEGVTQSSSEVTALVAEAVAKGTANINLMSEGMNATDVYAVDMGMARQVPGPRMVVCKEANGTENMAEGPAMSYEQAQRAVQAGIDLMGKMKQMGYCLVATGEMGIGNTTAASAIASVLLGCAPSEMTGRGAGLSDAGLERKISAIERAIAVNRPNESDPMDVLAKVGGYEIAGMAGAFIGGMVHRVPVVIDGVISAVAALAAVRLCPAAKDFMLASHVSREPAGRRILDALGLDAVIHGDMALGEGTGAVMLFPLLDMSACVYRGMHTFGDMGMDPYTPQEGNK